MSTMPKDTVKINHQKYIRIFAAPWFIRVSQRRRNVLWNAGQIKSERPFRGASPQFSQCAHHLVEQPGYVRKLPGFVENHSTLVERSPK